MPNSPWLRPVVVGLILAAPLCVTPSPDRRNPPAPGERPPVRASRPRGDEERRAPASEAFPVLLEENQSPEGGQGTSFPPSAPAELRLALSRYDGPRQDPGEPFDREAQRRWIRSLPPPLSDAVVRLKARAFLVRPAALRDFRLLQEEGDYYVQFAAMPDEAWRQAHAAKGLRLLDYVGNGTYRVASTEQALAGLAGDPDVMGVAPSHPEDRLAENMLRGQGLAPVALPDGSRGCRAAILLSEGEDFQRTAAMIRPFLLSVDAACPAEHRLLVTLRPERLLPLLAAMPGIACIDDAGFVAKKACNNRAALLSLVPFARIHHTLSGAGRTLALLDGGQVLGEHLEFGPGVVVDRTGGGFFDDHATHVAGTMAATGYEADARGMAPGISRLLSYWYGPLDDDVLWPANLDQAATEADAVNNSWNLLISCDNNPYLYGSYTSQSRLVDQAARRHPGCTVCWAAGNDRDLVFGRNCPPVDLTPYWLGGDLPRYAHADILPPHACAKNTLTVGALDPLARTTDFSAWGPADDGRIKPDLCARGEDVWSCVATSPSAYDLFSGTSMATPVVTGSVALLAEALQRRFGAPAVRSDIVKAVLIQTARDLYANNGYPGPDIMTGHGLMDVKAATDLILDPGQRIVTGSLAQGQTLEFGALEGDVGSILSATLAWIDPPGSPVAATALINDLDLQIIAPTGEVLDRSWRLDPADPARPATVGVNRSDPVEKAFLNDTRGGNYRIRLRGSLVPQGSQRFALALDRPLVDHYMVLSSPLRIGRTSTFQIQGAPGETYALEVSQESTQTCPCQLVNARVLRNGTLDATGRATVAVRIPNEASLVNRWIYAQAVVGSRRTAFTELLIQP